MPKDAIRKTLDPPAPRWPVRTPQVQPTLKKKGPKIGSSMGPKGGRKG